MDATYNDGIRERKSGCQCQCKDDVPSPLGRRTRHVAKEGPINRRVSGRIKRTGYYYYHYYRRPTTTPPTTPTTTPPTTATVTQAPTIPPPSLDHCRIGNQVCN